MIISAPYNNISDIKKYSQKILDHVSSSFLLNHTDKIMSLIDDLIIVIEDILLNNNTYNQKILEIANKHSLNFNEKDIERKVLFLLFKNNIEELFLKYHEYSFFIKGDFKSSESESIYFIIDDIFKNDTFTEEFSFCYDILLDNTNIVLFDKKEIDNYQNTKNFYLFIKNLIDNDIVIHSRIKNLGFEDSSSFLSNELNKTILYLGDI